MLNRSQELADRWRQTAIRTIATAKQLRNGDDHRSCVSRAYYAAYQATTAVCIAHGDAVNFPPGWNNPSHEQLPDLIVNNGNLSVTTRRWVRKALRELRVYRETADYRMGITVDRGAAISAILIATSILERLETEDADS